MTTVAPKVGVPPLATLKSMRGIDFLQGIVDGSLPTPPITQTLGFALSEVAPGYALFTMTPQFKH